MAFVLGLILGLQWWGYPSPITGSPHKEPRSPAPPRLRGFFFGAASGLTKRGGTALEGTARLRCLRMPASILLGTPIRFRLATWNINSVRLKVDLVEPLRRAHRPDILCLQEIKCIEGKFPELSSARRLPHIAVAGQKGYHGVAISRAFRSR